MQPVGRRMIVCVYENNRLEGSFLSKHKQFYSYILRVNGSIPKVTEGGSDNNSLPKTFFLSELSRYEPLHEKYAQAKENMHSYREMGGIDDADAAILYGLQMQIQKGNCNSECPGVIQALAVVKWHAWKSCEDMSSSEAMVCFVDEAQRICETSAKKTR